MNLYTKITPIEGQLADVVTPVQVYLKLRDIYPNTMLLESADYHAHSDAMSFICFDAFSEFMVEGQTLRIFEDNVLKITKQLEKVGDAVSELDAYVASFQLLGESKGFAQDYNGVFGYTGYDAVQHFDSLKLQSKEGYAYSVPDMRYAAYGKILCFSHYNNKLTLVENLRSADAQSEAPVISKFLQNPISPKFSFTPADTEESNVTDEEYMAMVRKGKEHCYRGDVFQIVLSRQYSKAFEGDEFNVYRALRQINPSPYMFYFDYGAYKIFGSSPETELIIKKGVAQINPIAGTYRRTGDEDADKLLGEKLSNDPKESAEHVMLVDLARNDLSRFCQGVKVNTFKEVQYYSHVMHLVSNVSGTLNEGANASKLMAATFPAGTLSGAPKYRAMQLINDIENQPRGTYAGCIGLFKFNKDFDHAIMIRTFLSKGNRLYYQAGAGVVAKSSEESELQEVKNKLGALTMAINAAKDF